jgi:hypothetical protein
VRWLSSNPAAAVVDSATGQVLAVSPGRAQVVAASGAWRDSVMISIEGASAQAAGPTARLRAPASLAISPQGALQVGDTAALGVAALDSNGRRIRAPRLHWSSSDPSVATVDSVSGRLRALAPGSALISARSGTASATLELEVLPAAVAAVSIEGRRPLKVGDSLSLRATTRDRHGHQIEGRRITWASSDNAVMIIDSASGLVHARAAGTAEITAGSEGTSGRVSITVLPEPRTLRAEEPGSAKASPSVPSASAQKAALRQRALEHVGAGVDRCYGALQRKDVVQLAELYDPQSKDDREKLKKLSRILRTDEWGAVVGPRVDSKPQIGAAAAAMEFNFPLSWKDAFGGRIRSRMAFRAEYALRGTVWEMTACRIVGSPKL